MNEEKWYIYETNDKIFIEYKGDEYFKSNTIHIFLSEDIDDIDNVTYVDNSGIYEDHNKDDNVNSYRNMIVENFTDNVFDEISKKLINV